MLAIKSDNRSGVCAQRMLQQSIGNCATEKLDLTIEFEIYVLASGKIQKQKKSNSEMKDDKNGKN